MNLRKAAEGRDCTVRLPGICNWNPETTVLAHIRRGHTAGVGQKPIDLIAVLACSACHDCIDGRRKSEVGDELDGYVLDAMCRTLALWNRLGYL